MAKPIADKGVRVTVTISKANKNKLDLLAKKIGLSRGAICNLALYDYFGKLKNQEETAQIKAILEQKTEFE